MANGHHCVCVVDSWLVGRLRHPGPRRLLPQRSRSWGRPPETLCLEGTPGQRECPGERPGQGCQRASYHRPAPNYNPGRKTEGCREGLVCGSWQPIVMVRQYLHSEAQFTHRLLCKKKRKSKIVEFKYVNKALVLQVSLWQTVQAAGPRCCGVYMKRWSRLA